MTIKVQGTRHASRAALLQELEVAVSRIRNGENVGTHHDDDFGYRFQVDDHATGPSFFDAPMVSL
jgi:hypothetical protein